MTNYDITEREQRDEAMLRQALEALKAENEALRADVVEWKARADDLATALNKCIRLAYSRDLDELPSAIIMTATRAVDKYDMLVDFSAALEQKT